MSMPSEGWGWLPVEGDRKTLKINKKGRGKVQYTKPRGAHQVFVAECPAVSEPVMGSGAEHPVVQMQPRGGVSFLACLWRLAGYNGPVSARTQRLLAVPQRSA